MAKKMGRPKIDMNKKRFYSWDQQHAVIQFGATLVEVSEILGISGDTIERRIRKEHDMTFAEYCEKKMAKAKHNLRKKMYETAMAGNVTMQIWLSKNWLGFKDSYDVDVSPQEIKIEFQ